MSLTITQITSLKLLVAEHLSAQQHLGQMLRTGSKVDVIEADADARKAADRYVKFVEGLLQSNAE